jgi:hypothetical protein
MLGQTTSEITAVILALIGIIGTLLGGFALLGRTMLKFVLGPNLDGKGGAWAEMTSRIEGTSDRLDALKAQHHEAEKRADERHEQVVSALVKIVPPEDTPTG